MISSSDNITVLTKKSKFRPKLFSRCQSQNKFVVPKYGYSIDNAKFLWIRQHLFQVHVWNIFRATKKNQAGDGYFCMWSLA